MTSFTIISTSDADCCFLLLLDEGMFVGEGPFLVLIRGDS